MKWDPDILADVEYHSAENFSNKEYLSTEYSIRLDHLVKEDYLTCGAHDYAGEERIYPGRKYETSIKFITPEIYPGCLWIGKEIPLQRGSRILGVAVVKKIFNPILNKPNSQPDAAPNEPPPLRGYGS